jgi:hypothetical protein
VRGRCVLDLRWLPQPIFGDRIVGSSTIVCEVAYLEIIGKFADVLKVD